MSLLKGCLVTVHLKFGIAYPLTSDYPIPSQPLNAILNHTYLNSFHIYYYYYIEKLHSSYTSTLCCWCIHQLQCIAAIRCAATSVNESCCYQQTDISSCSCSPVDEQSLQTMVLDQLTIDSSIPSV